MIENLKYPESVRHNLANVQNAIDSVRGNVPTEVAHAHFALAQTHALCAVVAAIDGVASEIAELRKTIAAQNAAEG